MVLSRPFRAQIAPHSCYFLQTSTVVQELFWPTWLLKYSLLLHFSIEQLCIAFSVAENLSFANVLWTRFSPNTFSSRTDLFPSKSYIFKLETTNPYIYLLLTKYCFISASPMPSISSWQVHYKIPELLSRIPWNIPSKSYWHSIFKSSILIISPHVIPWRSFKFIPGWCLRSTLLPVYNCYKSPVSTGRFNYDISLPFLHTINGK